MVNEVPDENKIDAKAKMLEALAKKQGKNTGGVKGGPNSGSKVGGSQNAAAAPKMFRRKSGPSGSAG